MSAATDIIRVVVTIAGLGVASQAIGDRMRVPSVLFLILAGVGVGPEGLGLITPEIFGNALSAIVGLSVAIIVFEGAFHLKINRLREAPRDTLRLTTVGAALSLVGTTVTVRYAIGTTWSVALLIGALLIATGPTVITPIVSIVPVRDRVAATLETEGVVNDVTAAILAIVMFEYVLLSSQGAIAVVREFAARLGLGILVGCGVAAVVWYVLRHIDLSVKNAPQNSRLIVLVSSLVMYGAAEMVASEAGIAAVAAGGFVLGNADIPYREDIEQFKGDVTLLVLSFVFVTLASLLSLSDLTAIGVGGIVATVVIAGVVRPVIVLLCTHSGRLTFHERLFVSAIGPRGIIPASVATLFALELRSTHPEAATTLVGTVFLVILVTIVVEGGLARHIAQALDVIPMRTIVVGGGRVGTTLAERLEDRGEEVLLIEEDQDVVQDVRQRDFNVVHGDGTDRETLLKAGIENAKVVAAATGDDDANLLISRHATTNDVDTVVARVNERENVEAFEDLDLESISSPMSVAWSMDNVIERPGIARWMKELDEEGDVQEVSVTSSEFVDRPIREIGPELPESCLIALVERDGEPTVPTADYILQDGDKITLIGHKASVREAIDSLTT